MNENQVHKEAFLAELREHLRQLPPEEIENAIAYYEEYLDDAGEENLAKTLETLGNPQAIAANLQANRAVAQAEEEARPRKGLPLPAAIILGIFAVPIGLPLAAAAFSVLLALAIVAFALVVVFLSVLLALVVSAGAVCTALALSGLFYVLLSFTVVFQSLATAFFFLGAGLCAIGLGLLAFPAFLWLARRGWLIALATCRAIPRLLSKIQIRRKPV